MKNIFITTFLIINLLLIRNFILAEEKTPLFGRAPYAILDPHFSCSAYQASTEGIGDYGIAFLWNTFGNNFSCLNKELSNSKVKLIEVHLLNGPCLRNQNCGDYEVLYGYTLESFKQALHRDNSKLKQKIQDSAEALSDYLLPKLAGDVACYINPILETNLESKGSQKIQSWIEPFFNDRCKFVWNPEGSSPGLPIPGTAVSEAHGQFPNFSSNDCIANPDGAVIDSVEDWKNYFVANKNCVAVLGWTQNDNCLIPNHDWKDPRARTCTDTSQFKNLHDGILAARKSFF